MALEFSSRSMSAVRFLRRNDKYMVAGREFVGRTCISSAAFFLSSSLSPGICGSDTDESSVLLGTVAGPVESMSVYSGVGAQAIEIYRRTALGLRYVRNALAEIDIACMRLRPRSSEVQRAFSKLCRQHRIEPNSSA